MFVVRYLGRSLFVIGLGIVALNIAALNNAAAQAPKDAPAEDPPRVDPPRDAKARRSAPDAAPRIAPPRPDQPRTDSADPGPRGVQPRDDDAEDFGPRRPGPAADARNPRQPGQPGRDGAPPPPGRDAPINRPRPNQDYRALPGGPPLPFGGPPGAPQGGPPGGRGMPFDYNLERNDPEMAAIAKAEQDLERKTIELQNTYRRSPAQRDGIKKQLADLVGQHFEVRQKHRELDLKRMEEQLARLRDAIKSRSAKRDQIIKARLTQLIGPEEDLDF